MPAKSPCNPIFNHAPSTTWRALAKVSHPRPENLYRRLAHVSTPASYRLFPGRANYFQPSPKAHRNGADKLIECELDGCLGKAGPGVARSGKPK